MTNYRRHQPAVIRESDSSSLEDNWMNQLAKNLERNAVEPRKDRSLFEQINSIMNNKKSKFSSVEDAVQDMRERSGLVDYLKKVKDAKAAADKKIAQSNDTPKIFQSAPMVKNTLENFIRSTNGNPTVPAIIERVKQIHSMDVPNPGDWDEENFIKYVSRLKEEEQKKHPKNETEYSDLGKSVNMQDKDIDSENTDAFHALMPAVTSG